MLQKILTKNILPKTRLLNIFLTFRNLQGGECARSYRSGVPKKIVFVYFHITTNFPKNSHTYNIYFRKYTRIYRECVCIERKEI